MKKFLDYQQKEVWLSDESWEHILVDHPEIALAHIEKALSDPDEVRMSSAKANAKLYYRLKIQTETKTRHICIVVKITAKNEEFIVSAMTTSSVKDGEIIFKREA